MSRVFISLVVVFIIACQAIAENAVDYYASGSLIEVEDMDEGELLAEADEELEDYADAKMSDAPDAAAADATSDSATPAVVAPVAPVAPVADAEKKKKKKKVAAPAANAEKPTADAPAATAEKKKKGAAPAANAEKPTADAPAATAEKKKKGAAPAANAEKKKGATPAKKGAAPAKNGGKKGAAPKGTKRRAPAPKAAKRFMTKSGARLTSKQIADAIRKRYPFGAIRTGLPSPNVKLLAPAPGTPTPANRKIYRQLARAHEKMYDETIKNHNKPYDNHKFSKRQDRHKLFYNYYYTKKYNKLMQPHTVNFDHIRKLVTSRNPNLFCTDCQVDSIEPEDTEDVIRVEIREDGKLTKVYKGNDAVVELAGTPEERIARIRGLLQAALKTGKLQLDDMSAMELTKYLRTNDVLKPASPPKVKKVQKKAAKPKTSTVKATNPATAQLFKGEFKYVRGGYSKKDVDHIYTQLRSGANTRITEEETRADKRISDIIRNKGMTTRLIKAPLPYMANKPDEIVSYGVGKPTSFFY